MVACSVGSDVFFAAEIRTVGAIHHVLSFKATFDLALGSWVTGTLPDVVMVSPCIGKISIHG